jgi:hypothetical protein
MKSYQDLDENEQIIAQEAHPEDYEQWSYTFNGVELYWSAK